jgi:hypothetical protein
MSVTFEYFLSKLDEQENEEVLSNKIDSPLKLIPLLLKRVHPKNVHVLAAIIKQSLLPSICEKTNEEIYIALNKAEDKLKKLAEFEKAQKLKNEKNRERVKNQYKYFNLIFKQEEVIEIGEDKIKEAIKELKQKLIDEKGN